MKYKKYLVIGLILVLSIIYIKDILLETSRNAHDIDINGGFESGITGPYGWKLVGHNGYIPIWDNTIFYEGSKSIKISILPGTKNIRNVYAESQKISVDANTYYMLSLYLKTKNISGYSDLIKISQFDVNGSIIKTDITPDWDQPKDWGEKITLIKTDKNTVNIDIQIDMEKGNGTFWVDNIKLSKMNLRVNKWHGRLQCYNKSREEPIPGLIDHMTIFEGIALHPTESPDDGDIFFDVKPLNSFYDNMLTDTNFSQKDGRSMHIEVEPSCQGNIPLPREGDYVFIVGDYRLDIGHAGWAEIHPVRLILFIKPKNNSDDSNITFKLSSIEIKIDKQHINLGEGFNISGSTVHNTTVWLQARKSDNIDQSAILHTRSDNDGNFRVSINSTPILNILDERIFSAGRWYIRATLPEIGSVSQSRLIEINHDNIFAKNRD